MEMLWECGLVGIGICLVVHVLVFFLVVVGWFGVFWFCFKF